MTPYDILGLPPDADPAQVKAAYHRLAMQYHPDRNPGDPAAAERMAEVNAAYEAITKGVPWGGIYGFVCLLVVAIAGSGKTRRLAEALSALDEARVVIACPTIKLISEVQDWHQKFDAEVPVTAIHSDQHGDRFVRQRIWKYFEDAVKKPDPRGGILVCSHAAIFDLGPPPINASDYSLFFDEIPDCYSFVVRRLDDGIRWVSHLIEATSFRKGVLRLQPAIGAENRLDWIRKNPHGCEVNALFSDLAAHLLDPQRHIFVLEDRWMDITRAYSPHVYGGEIDILSILHPDRFKRWKSCTMMGARAANTMTHLLWSRLFGQRFSEHPLQTGLPSQHTNGDRLLLRYFWQDRATRAMLARRAEGGGTMQQAMCRSVAEYYRGRPFLWSLPQAGADGGVRDTFWQATDGAFQPKLRLPGRSFGLNTWRSYHALALLSVINLSPSQYQLLGLLGVPPDDVFDALSCTILYQDLFRSSLRDPKATDRVESVVPCLPSTSALARLLPGADVQIMPEHLIPQLAELQKRGPKPTGRTPDAERQRKSRAARRAAMEHTKERARESV